MKFKTVLLLIVAMSLIACNGKQNKSSIHVTDSVVVSVETPLDSPTESYSSQVQNKEEPKLTETSAPYTGHKVFGKWNMVGAVLTIYQKGDKCYMVNDYGDGKYDDPERFIKTTYHGQAAFKNAEDPNDMYVINSSGDLDGYAFGDLACTFRRIN